MSKVGKKPIELPGNVKFSVDGSLVTVEGPKGKLQQAISSNVKIEQQGTTLTVKPCSTSEQARKDFGTSRALLNNMVVGVVTGFARSLELQGVGFVAQLVGKELVLKVGFSHEVRLVVPEGVTCVIEKPTLINLSSANKQVLGNFAASVRKVYPPEPYLGKGIRYSDEKVRRKAGKTGAAK